MTPESSSSDEIRRFEEQYERQPDSLVFARLADAYRKAGEPKRALSVLEHGLLRHPDYPSGHIVHARTLRDLGRLDESLESFRRVLELDASNLVAMRELAGLAEERGDVEEARHWYERLAQIEPGNPEYDEKVIQLVEAGEPEPPAASDAGIQLGDGSAWSEWWDDSAVTMEPGAAAWEPLDGGEEPGSEEAPEDDPDLHAIDAETDLIEIQTGPVELELPAAPGEQGQPEVEAGVESRSEDEAVEAILNGDVPHTVKAEDTWWYEEAGQTTEPEPEASRDADLLTRTMADLYAEQGLHSEAEAIYVELLASSPDDPDLLARLEAVRDRAPEEPDELRPAEAEPAAPAEEPSQVPVPVGPPSGVPVAEELRQLLRHGEERARDLPDPEERITEPGEVEATADAPSEPVQAPRDAPQLEAESAGLPEEGPSMGEFAREWLRGLEGGA